MTPTAKAALEKAWARRCALQFLGQQRYEAALLCWNQSAELSADTALDLHRGNSIKELAERQWVRAILKHAGNVKLELRWSSTANDFEYVVAGSVVFTPVLGQPSQATQEEV